MIFDPSEHELLVSDVVRVTDNAYDEERRWPLHPEDTYGTAREPYSGVYCGAAGTMWALTRLAQAHGILLKHDYGSAVTRCEKIYRESPTETETVVPSYFLGTVGIMLARYAITGDRTILGKIETESRANVGNPAREAF